MKKIGTLLLSLMMLCSTAALATACRDDDEPTPCVEHVDGNNDGLCDVCDETYTPAVSEVTVTFTAKDLEENTIAGIAVNISADNQTPVTAVSGADGTFSATLSAGTYTLSVGDYNVDAVGYYLLKTTSVTIEQNVTAVNIYFENTTPNGTANRPYVLSSENQITIPANTAYYYVVYRSNNLYAEVIGENVKVTYNTTVYEPDAEGNISIQLMGRSIYETDILLFENTSAIEQTYTVNLTSAPGTYDNPYELTLDQDVTTKELANRESVYYTYTATENGKLTLTLKTENGYVSMANIANSDSVATEENVMTIELVLNAGDTVKIDCSISLAAGSTASVTFNAVFTANE